jgi:hypothetical protein
MAKTMNAEEWLRNYASSLEAKAESAKRISKGASDHLTRASYVAEEGVYRTVASDIRKYLKSLDEQPAQNKK